jgi:hypothetical protein
MFNAKRQVRHLGKEQNSMKTFDWTKFSDEHKPAWATWLEANHDKAVTQAEYIAAYRLQRKDDTRPHKARRYATAKLRQSFLNLQEDFGFFVQ